jgi:hypothetical protein
MPRFFFHVRHGSDLILDKTGFELAGLVEARRKAWEDAKETAVSGKQGAYNQKFVITDENGMIIFTYPFKEAFKSTKN